MQHILLRSQNISGMTPFQSHKQLITLLNSSVRQLFFTLESVCLQAIVLTHSSNSVKCNSHSSSSCQIFKYLKAEIIQPTPLMLNIFSICKYFSMTGAANTLLYWSHCSEFVFIVCVLLKVVPTAVNIIFSTLVKGFL